MTSGLKEGRGAPAGGGDPARAHDGSGSPAPAAALTGVVIATTPAEDGRPAAALPWGEATVVRRLVEQLAQIEVGSVEVVVRAAAESELREALAGLPMPVELHVSQDVPADLRAVAAVARHAHGGLVIVPGNTITHSSALAGLLRDPRISTGVLATSGGRLGQPFALRTRSARGRVASASSPYHSVHRANTRSLGVLKIGPGELTIVAEVAEHMADLVTPPLPPGWLEELERKEEAWRSALTRAVGGSRSARRARADADDQPEVTDAGSTDPAVLRPTDEEEIRRRMAAAPYDVTGLLLAGLVRAGAQVSNSFLRGLFWARPLDRLAAERAGDDITLYNEDRALLNTAVKANDGFFTTFFVSPYSKYVARWAAHHGWTPNAVTSVSMGIGVLAAAGFATGERWGLIAGAILLQLAFTTDCVDGQLARYTHQFSKLGAWLDSIFDRTKEYAVFAGLAIGASQSGDPAWILAGCALTLQTVRHMFDFSYADAQRDSMVVAPQRPIEEPSDRAAPGPAPRATPPLETPVRAPLVRRVARRGSRLWSETDSRPAVVWVKKVIAFPIGERFAVISLAAALTTPRTTIIVVLVLSGIASLYSLIGRLLRSMAG